jgi:broad specificity polyphosphatase/5'/3'-nucleotidase SurE
MGVFDAFSARHQVTVIAPDRERSAVGHGITLHQPIRFENTRVNGGMAALPSTARLQIASNLGWPN